MEFNTLTTTLTNFIGAFSGAYDRLLPVRNGLLGALLGIEILLFGFWLALDGADRIGTVIKKILFLGFWIWLTTSFPVVAKAFVDSLIRIGLMAGGRPGDYQLLLDPSRIAGYGLNATDALSQALDHVGFDIVDAIIFGLSYIAIMVAFMVMAVQAFLAVLEYYLMLAIVGVLMPFGILPQTKFLAEKAIAAIVACGIKLMVLAFILAVAEPVLANVRFSGTEIKLNELWSVLLTSGGIALLAWKTPGFAAGLLAGSPSLGAGELAQNTTAGAMIAGGVVAGAVGATRAATNMAVAAGGHAARAAGFVSQASQLGPGGALGVAQTAGSSALNSARTGLARLRDGVGAQFRSGAQAASAANPGPSKGASGHTRSSSTAVPPGAMTFADKTLVDAAPGPAVAVPSNERRDAAG
jgi:type IV secretion system protein TrbL